MVTYKYLQELGYLIGPNRIERLFLTPDFESLEKGLVGSNSPGSQIGSLMIPE
jgi:hypothetical protein